MDLSSSIIFNLIHFLLLVYLICPIYSSEIRSHQLVNQTFRNEEKFHKLKKMISNRLQHINKPAVKSIQSPDGDIIDCVMSYKQPAFDHPLLKGQKSLDPPERSKGNNKKNISSDNFQLWSLSGESCPKGTIPIRRIKEEDILRVNSISKFGRKLNNVRRDINDNDTDQSHEHVVGYVDGREFYGGKATFNVWAPHVETQNEFSLTQMWIMSYESHIDVDTIEAGWQVYSELYGDNRPRLFIYWTADSYKKTGCYNLLCAGFVQTSNSVVLGAALSPISVYNGHQASITLSIWKDPINGHWWLEYGPGTIVGYWPSSLFSNLKYYANEVHFGGEIANKRSTGSHTTTQMGSGHFAEEGFAKAAHVKNLQVADSSNNFIPLSNPKFMAESPNCYDIKAGISEEWGNYFYYGGPGKNAKCP